MVRPVQTPRLARAFSARAIVTASLPGCGSARQVPPKSAFNAEKNGRRISSPVR